MISLNDLHIDSTPRLIFMANSLQNKGRSNKSYTIKIVRDGWNDYKLGGILTGRAGRINKIECSYTVDNITLIGTLIIDTIRETYAQGVFISGNGKLWEGLANKNLRSFDWSAWSHTLTHKTVTDSEAGGKYVYDLCDRGKWLQDNLIGISSPDAIVDIIERYPAMNIKEMLILILNEQGYNLSTTTVEGVDRFSDAYLLFTQDKNIRNDSTWLKNSLFKANSSGGSYTDTDIPINTTFLIEDVMAFPTEEFDEGNNFDSATTKKYVVPQTGTYRFISYFNMHFIKNTGSTVTGETCEMQLKRNGTTIFKQIISVPSAWKSGDPVFDATGTLDTKYRQFTAGDEITIYLYFTGEITNGTNWTITVSQGSGCNFYNDISRWYGYGSIVDFSKIVPDMTALEFISNVFDYLNIYTFYKNETKYLEIRQGRKLLTSADNLELLQIIENITEPLNHWLRYNTDKAAPLLDEYIDNTGHEDLDSNFTFSRTLVDNSRRLFGNTTYSIPILWESKDLNPLDMRTRFTPPEWVTKGNLRILLYDGAADIGANYDLSYGGSTTQNVSNVKVFPAFSEVDVEELHRYDLSLEGTIIKAICKLPIAKLYDQTYFKSPVSVVGVGLFWILEAEQIEGNIFNVTLESANKIIPNTAIEYPIFATSYILSIGGEKLLTVDSDYIIH